MKVLHVLAVGLWFGGAGFFNFVTAPSLFRSFDEVVRTAPSDRTAGVPIVPAGTSDEARKNLANALAGAAVGPIFPVYYLMQALCGAAALGTALQWWNAGGRVHRWRVVVLGLALLANFVGYPVSEVVSDLRPKRFDPDPDAAAAARHLFGVFHLVSLGLSVVAVSLAGVGLALAAYLPAGDRFVVAPDRPPA